ncbi:hypothetical protein DL93DRAFT_2217500 [Clavulina sp. PMI_390]|nr:hypothetical protein DL93DRAFT_2217500 [Clavulina sp. PMI_390]
MLWPLLSLSLVGSIASVAAEDAASTSAPVRTWLRSSWSAPDLLLEIIETTALEEPRNYFVAFDTLTDPWANPNINAEDVQSTTGTAPSDEQTYSRALGQLTLAGVFAEQGSRFTFDLSLSLHSATPAIEAFYQYYLDAVKPKHDSSSDCLSWVHWGQKVVCDPAALEELLKEPSVPSEDADEESAPSLLPFDHIFPFPGSTLETPSRVAILYVAFEADDFRALHELLYKAASRPGSDIQYVIRYIPPSTPRSSRNYLTGYGVTLDLKKMDYLALDDRRSSSSSQGVVESDDDVILALIQSFPEDTNATHYPSPLEKEELLEIAVRAAHLVKNASEPLTVLRQLSQNFPKFANTIARRAPLPDGDFIAEVGANRMALPQGFSGFWMNGLMINEADLNILSLAKMLRAEQKRMLSLREVGLSPSQAVDVIAWAPPRSEVQQTILEGYFDASDRVEGGDVVMWFNDIEKDSRYSQWMPSLQGLFQGGMFGQLPMVKRNLFNIILAVDLSLPSSLEFIVNPIPTIIGRSIPFRWGIAPNVETEAAQKMARLFYFSMSRYGRKKTIDMLRELMDMNRVSVDLHKARQVFDRMEQEHRSTDGHDSKEPVITFEAVINSAAEESVERASAYATRLGATKASFANGHVFLNGKHFDFTPDFLRILQGEISGQTQYLIEQIYNGKLQDSDELDMSVFFYDLPSTVKRRNKYIYPSSKAGSLKVFDLPLLFDQVALDRATLDYLYPSDEEVVPFTIWIVGDLDEPGHVDLLREAALAMNTTTSFRLGYIHAPTSDAHPGAVSVKPVDLEAQAILSEESKLHGILNSLVEIDQVHHAEYAQASALLSRQIGLGEGQLGLIINGRVIGPIEPGSFSAPDFDSLCAYELQKSVNPVLTALNATYPALDELDKTAYSELITMATSVVASASVPDPIEQGLRSAQPPKRSRVYSQLDGRHSSFEIGNKDAATIQIGLILDPLSTAAQKWSSILSWLSEADFVHTYVLLNPQPSDQLPLKRFYRYNLPGQLNFDENGNQADASVSFHGLPPDPIYTLGMEVPQSWMVRPRESPYDLDNIHLATLSPTERTKGVEAIFDLDFLVIEGHAREANNAPPRGVQLQLTGVGTESNATEPIADTLVMANLGYLQFRATPGVFQLGIKPGRGREVFEMESAGNQGWDSPTVHDAGDMVTLTSFEGLTLYPRLKRRAGMESEDVLEHTGSGQTVEQVMKKGYEWVKSYFNKEQSTTEVSKKVQADINIFTVASGLLYERFVGIMILSVLKNTKSTVKFWFIENFLSPAFLEFIPHMAEAYGFQYELVTYKWPSWLRAQTEKQRIIWAYKILFLDVLFPMDLKKVIFVDADQIVRADLKELVDLDLHGAPYGYTPMGDDNTDMEGFRFWKTGYWKDFLRGKPYHISALYVIDLVRFREFAAGDKLRGQYQSLSADPNSLSNLDQDLPNNLQHDVPIFSLPEDWLWCETWCSKDRFDRAKTIDLCQNPLTKEPKLDRARSIPEWELYDAEIAKFAQSLVEQGKIKSAAVAASVNELASIGSTAKKADAEPPAKDSEAVPEAGHEQKHDASEL